MVQSLPKAEHADSPKSLPPNGEGKPKAWWLALTEAFAIWSATVGLIARLTRYAAARWKARALRRSVVETGVALARQAHASSIGPHDLRGQLTAVDEQVRQSGAGKRPAAELRNEQDRLLSLLADALLSDPKAAAHLGEAYRQAGQARETLRLHEEASQEAVAHLLPEGAAAWRRVGIGVGLAAVLFVGFVLLIASGGRKARTDVADADGSPTRDRPSPGVATPDLGGPEPLYQGKPLSHWVRLLQDADAQTRLKAAEAVGKIGPRAAAATPALIPLLSDGDQEVRQAAIRSLGAIGPGAKGAVGPLVEVLKDRESRWREEAAAALGKIGPDARAAVGPLADCLREKGLSTVAAVALGQIGPDAAPAVRPLIGLLAYEGETASQALARIGEPAVKPLADALQDKNWLVRRYAARTLGRIGPRAGAAAPELIQALEDETSDVRSDACLALGGLKARSAVAPLIRRLEDRNEYVRCAAARALGEIGADAQPATAALEAMLKDGRREVRFEAACALAHVSPSKAARAVDEIIFAFFRDASEEETYLRAIHALGSIGPDARRAVPRLLPLAADTSNARIRDAAREALKRIDPDAAKKVGAQ